MDASRVHNYRTLLEVSRCISVHHDIDELFRHMARPLHGVVEFEFLGLALHDPARNTMRRHLLNGSQTDLIRELPVGECPSGWVLVNQRPLIVRRLLEETRWPAVISSMSQHGVQSCCWLPLTTAQRPLGALLLARDHGPSCTGPDLQFLQYLAQQIALAVDNAMNSEAFHRSQQALKRERDRLRALLDITGVLVSNLEPRDLFAAISKCLREVISYDYAAVAVRDSETGLLRTSMLDFPGASGLVREGTTSPIDGCPAGLAFSTRRPVRVDALPSSSFRAQYVRLLVAEGLKSMCSVPLVARGTAFGVLSVARSWEGAFTPDDEAILTQAAGQVAIALDNALAFRQITSLGAKLAAENLCLQRDTAAEHDFGEIVGGCTGLRKVLQTVELVAPSDATVLILGETGTGKELIARAIHRASRRRENTLVRLNCAAIPAALLESELFGHEKGAFTGALARKLGRFELADKGTLFLDEVGDFPLDLQPKLLRALQEREFERLGGSSTVRVDLRLIAASNRDLPRMVADREFRMDLYYRLNVVPVRVPPLRERVEDIPDLAAHFCRKAAQRLGCPAKRIAPETMKLLVEYPWPGNVRELQNVIERAVILSGGPELHVPRQEFEDGLLLFPHSKNDSVSLEEAERKFIMRALDEANWVIGGPTGAAVRLGLKRTTLQAKMRRLSIHRGG